MRGTKRVTPAGPAMVGKNGEGACSAMTQIAQDRVVAARDEPLTAEEQIKGLWRLRVPAERTVDGLWTLQTWLSENAPELLQDKGDSFQYLMALLSNEMSPGPGSDP